jgi:hypothetical protein
MVTGVRGEIIPGITREVIRHGGEEEAIRFLRSSDRKVMGSGSFALELLPHTFGIRPQDIHTLVCQLACFCNLRGNLCRRYGTFRENLE